MQVLDVAEKTFLESYLPVLQHKLSIFGMVTVVGGMAASRVLNLLWANTETFNVSRIPDQMMEVLVGDPLLANAVNSHRPGPRVRALIVEFTMEGKTTHGLLSFLPHLAMLGECPLPTPEWLCATPRWNSQAAWDLGLK
jgi:hypothetical protein